MLKLPTNCVQRGILRATVRLIFPERGAVRRGDCELFSPFRVHRQFTPKGEKGKTMKEDMKLTALLVGFFVLGCTFGCAFGYYYPK